MTDTAETWVIRLRNQAPDVDIMIVRFVAAALGRPAEPHALTLVYDALIEVAGQLDTFGYQSTAREWVTVAGVVSAEVERRRALEVRDV